MKTYHDVKFPGDTKLSFCICFSRYSWCSEYLVTNKFHWSQGVQLDDLIPLETSLEMKVKGDESRLVIGHNVAFDRSFVKEQYYIKVSVLGWMPKPSPRIIPKNCHKI